MKSPVSIISRFTQLSSLNRSAFALALIAGLSGSLLVSCGSEPLPAGQAEFARGLEALHNADFEESERLFNEAQTVDPASPWRLLGESAKLRLTSAKLGALQSFEAMIAVAPDFDSAYTGYCRVALDAGKRFLAEQMVREYGSTFNLGDETSTDPERQRNFLLIRARIALLSGEAAEAESLISELASTRQADARLRLTLAESLYRQGKTAQARELADNAFADSDKRTDDVHAMVDFCILSNQAVQASELIEELLDDESENLAVLRFAIERYISLGYLDYADDLVYRLETLGKSVTQSRYLKAVLAEAAGVFVRALRLFEYSLSEEIEGSPNVEMFREFARTNARMGNFIGAQDNYDLLVSYAEKSQRSSDFIADIHMEVTEMLVSAEQWIDGVSRSDKARPQYTDTPRLELILARAKYALLLPDTAQEIINHYSASAPLNTEWSQALARSWAQFDQMDSVRHYLDRALEYAPGDFGSLFALLQLQQRTADSVGFDATLAKMVELYGDDRRVMRLQASLYAGRGEDIRLLEIAKRMIELFPGDMSTYQLAARSAGRKYGAAQAREFYQLAIDNNPNLAAAYHISAIDFLAQREIDSATEYLNKAFELRPQYPAGELARGVIFESQGEIDSAAATYGGIIEREPFSAEAYNNLAWLLATNELELPRAENLAREAISLSAGVSANTFGTYGWVLHKSKRYDQANTAYQRAIQLAPSDPIKFYLQGINFEVWGKPDQAREHLQKAIDLGISGNYLSLTQQAISRLDS